MKKEIIFLGISIAATAAFAQSHAPVVPAVPPVANAPLHGANIPPPAGATPPAMATPNSAPPGAPALPQGTGNKLNIQPGFTPDAQPFYANGRLYYYYNGQFYYSNGQPVQVGPNPQAVYYNGQLYYYYNGQFYYPNGQLVFTR